MTSHLFVVSRYILTILLSYLFILSVAAQKYPIYQAFHNSEEYSKYCKVGNGSFEINNNSNSPYTFDVLRWGFCGFKGETPPTVQCNDQLHFAATTKTPFGNCYINLVTNALSG